MHVHLFKNLSETMYSHCVRKYVIDLIVKENVNPKLLKPEESI